MTFNFKKSIGALTGNAMQFYDFTIYAFLAPYISKEFFDFKNQYLSYLVIFSIFAGGYLTRPFGSLLFGSMGDRKGRSQALSKTILIATFSTFLIGVIPGYKEIGIFAPLSLVILRLIQGVAVSGEEGGAVVLLFEKFAFKNKGVIGGAVLSSVLIGVIFGSLLCSGISQLIFKSLIGEWAWRIPFLLALPFGMVATMLRYFLNDFELFKQAERNHLVKRNPIKFLILNHSYAIAYGFCVVAMYSITTSTLIIHMPYFLTVKTGIAHNHSLLILTLAISLVAFLTPLFGKLSDKIDTGILYNISLMALIVLAPFLFTLMASTNSMIVFITILSFSAIIALISSTIFSILVGIFPFSVRYSGVSLSFNLSITVFSSSTPLILIYIENCYSSLAAPGTYISLLTILFLLLTSVLKRKIMVLNYNETNSETSIYNLRIP